MSWFVLISESKNGQKQSSMVKSQKDDCSMQLSLKELNSTSMEENLIDKDNYLISMYLIRRITDGLALIKTPKVQIILNLVFQLLVV